jgi:hypothetical protein
VTPVSSEYFSAMTIQGLVCPPLALPKAKVKLSAAAPDPPSPESESPSPPPPHAASVRAPTVDTATSVPRRPYRPGRSWGMVEPFVTVRRLAGLQDATSWSDRGTTT